MTSSPRQNRWALVVGIDKYPLLGSEARLDGCVADAREMARVLGDRFGFAQSRTTLLLDEQATRGAILGALDDLAGRVSEDDAVVFHYSGHGSQRTAPVDNRSEPDAMEETLVPYDSGRRDPFPNRDISGGEIHDWLLRITKVTPYVTVIFDCCHSGTAVRTERAGAKIRRVPPDLRPPEGPGKPRLRDFRGGPASFGRYVLLAACRNKESAYEIEHEGRSHGAMSHFLLEELRALPPGACPSYRDVFDPVSSRVHDLHPCQQPQLEGFRDRELFGLAELIPQRFVPVRQRRAERVVLGAGATCGLEPGAVLSVHPPHAKEWTEPLGRVEVIEVRAVTSTSHILEEVRPDAIGRWCRAVETGGRQRPPGVLGLRNDASPLRGKIDFNLARLAPEGRWVRVDDGDELFEGDSVSFSVTNRASIPLFVYVLDCGPAGNVGPVYPVQGACDPLAPGRSIEIGTRPGEEIDLYVPEGATGGDAVGEEVLKLFVTTREADLAPLYQTAVRDARPNPGLSGMPMEDWTTIERRFVLKRRR